MRDPKPMSDLKLSVMVLLSALGCFVLAAWIIHTAVS